MVKVIRIGDEVWVHGYVDEIRKDCIIIRNDGGYFGTIEAEVCGMAEVRGMVKENRELTRQEFCIELGKLLDAWNPKGNKPQTETEGEEE